MNDPLAGDVGPDDLAAGIFSRGDYVAARPPPREFKPWHLPRKQFVRREQWVAQGRRAFEGRDDNRPVTYLGLPGVDLLDLRYLHAQICVPLDRSLRFLGFNSEAGSSSDAAVELNTSTDEVIRLASVDPQSEVIHDDFRALARADSMAWKKARRLGPFDIVNLDLCDGIATDDPAIQQSLYRAIAALLSLQVRSPTPWLLLVTTRIGLVHFHDEALIELLARFNANVHSCETFAGACRELLSVDEPGAIDPQGCSAEVFLRMTLVALCKWLMSLGQVQSANRVELVSSQGYRVHTGAPCEDLVSFALVFTPVIQSATDPLRAQPTDPVDECVEATRIAGRARSLRDVDGILAGNAELFEELAGETEALLRAARYDAGAYRTWLANRVTGG